MCWCNYRNAFAGDVFIVLAAKFLSTTVFAVNAKHFLCFPQLAGDTSSGSVKLEVLDDDEEDTTTTTTSSSSSSTSEPKPRVPLFSPQPAIDQKLVEDFLSGDYCLHGVSGMHDGSHHHSTCLYLLLCLCSFLVLFVGYEFN